MKNAKTFVAAVLLAGAGVASASEPVALSNEQMDHVSAGATAGALALANAVGDLISATQALTSTLAVYPGLATATAKSTAIGASVHFPAAVATRATATASLP